MSVPYAARTPQREAGCEVAGNCRKEGPRGHLFQTQSSGTGWAAVSARAQLGCGKASDPSRLIRLVRSTCQTLAPACQPDRTGARFPGCHALCGRPTCRKG